MRIKKELILITSGLILIAGVAMFIFYSMNFLIVKINSALDAEQVGGQTVQRINFEELERIGLIK